jgi:rubrerythrin
MFSNEDLIIEAKKMLEVEVEMEEKQRQFYDKLTNPELKKIIEGPLKDESRHIELMEEVIAIARKGERPSSF